MPARPVLKRRRVSPVLLVVLGLALLSVFAGVMIALAVFWDSFSSAVGSLTQ